MNSVRPVRGFGALILRSRRSSGFTKVTPKKSVQPVAPFIPIYCYETDYCCYTADYQVADNPIKVIQPLHYQEGKSECQKLFSSSKKRLRRNVHANCLCFYYETSEEVFLSQDYTQPQNILIRNYEMILSE